MKSSLIRTGVMWVAIYVLMSCCAVRTNAPIPIGEQVTTTALTPIHTPQLQEIIYNRVQDTWFYVESVQVNEEYRDDTVSFFQDQAHYYLDMYHQQRPNSYWGWDVTLNPDSLDLLRFRKLPLPQ